MESVKILQKPLTINSNIIVVDDRALKYAKIIDTVMSKTFLRKLKDMDITVYVTTLYEYYAEWKKKAEYRDTEIKEVDIGSSGFITLFNEDLAIIYISFCQIRISLICHIRMTSRVLFYLPVLVQLLTILCYL